MNDMISVAVIFSLIAVASQVYSIWNNHKKNQQEEERKAIEAEKNFLKLDIKLDNVIGAATNILDKQEKQAIRIEQLSGEIIKSNEKISTLFKYKDDHEQRISNLEGRA
jgi:peptidoglycan hydrolase CwlO-like protein